MITFLGNGHNNHLYEDIIFKYRNDKDVLVSCQYSHKVSGNILSTQPSVNIHYGVLPHYRGLNPIYWQMMNGYEVGVTLHWMDEGFDTGDIIDTYSFPHHGRTADECYKECEKQGVRLLEYWMPFILDGTTPRKKQGDGRFWKKAEVDWKTVNKIHTPFFDPSEVKRIFATHFEGKQYPEMEIGGRTFELRLKK